MKRKTDNKSLLDDVLAEAAPPDFREALLEETLGLVRRRRRFRHARNAAGILTALALLSILFWQKSVKQSYALVSTQPLSPNHVVQTRSFGTPQIITSRATVEIVQTTAGNFHVINDEQLLALTADHPAILVRTGPHSEELVFANPGDTEGSN